jgi:SPP1 gp7 family putative phage head morphogenesis protein
MVSAGELAVELPDYRLQGIFRTNVMSAYSRGRYLEQAAEKGDYGWYQYHTAEDPGVRPNHAALNGLVIRFGSPEGDRVYPPNGYQCRCWAQLLADEQARAKRTKSESETRAIIEATPPDDGFEGSPFEGTSSLSDPGVISYLERYRDQAMSEAE